MSDHSNSPLGSEEVPAAKWATLHEHQKQATFRGSLGTTEVGLKALPISNLKTLETLPLNAGGSPAEQEPLGQHGTTQEVQTSFMPSIKDSAEFRKIGDSLSHFPQLTSPFNELAVNPDRHPTQGMAVDLRYGQQFINMQDFEQTQEHHSCSGVSPCACQGHENCLGCRWAPPSASAKLGAATTRRNASLHSDNCTQPLPCSAETSSRVSEQAPHFSAARHQSTSKRESVTPSQVNIKQGNNQILQQIFISVNKMHSSELSPASRASQLPQHQALNMQQTANRRVGADQDQQSQEGTAPHLKSLIIQPILLGVKAVSRSKQRTAFTEQTPLMQMGGFSPKLGQILPSPVPKSPITVVSTKPYPIQKLQVRTRGEEQRSKKTENTNANLSVGPPSLTVTLSQNARAQPKAGKSLSPTGKRIIKETAYTKGISEHIVSDAGKNVKMALVLGPQLLSSLSKDEAAHARAAGLNPVDPSQPPEHQIFYGQPLIVDQHSKLGQQVLNEQRKRKQMEAEQAQVNQIRIQESQDYKRFMDGFGHLTANKKPAHPINRVVSRKVDAQLKGEAVRAHFEKQRQILWADLKHSQGKSHNQGAASQRDADLSLLSPTNLLEARDKTALSPELAAAYRTELKQMLNDVPSDSLNPWCLQGPFSSEPDDKVRVKSESSQEDPDQLRQPNHSGTDRPSTLNKTPLTQLDSQSPHNKSVVDTAKEIAQAAELARQLDPDNFRQIQEIIYETLSQTDILSSPELQQTLTPDPTPGNPNAIVIRNTSLSDIATVLHSPASAGARASDAGGEPLLASQAVQQMDLEQFSEALRSLYLPFTLRQMYYRELLERKPLFVGASKKGVGFAPPLATRNLLNERTCAAQQKHRANGSRGALQRTLNKTLSPRSDYNNNLGLIAILGSPQEGPLQVSRMQISRNESRIKSPVPQGGQRTYRRECLVLKDHQLRKQNLAKGEAGAQTDMRKPGSSGSSHDKGIDMQSFGDMTGADPLVVREIEQLISLDDTGLESTSPNDELLINRPESSNQVIDGLKSPSNNTTALRITENRHHTGLVTPAETAPSAKSLLNDNQKALDTTDNGTASVAEQKRSKVIFSVKKDQGQCKKQFNRDLVCEAAAGTAKPSNQAGRKGSRFQSSREGSQLGEKRPSSALSQPGGIDAEANKLSSPSGLDSQHAPMPQTAQADTHLNQRLQPQPQAQYLASRARAGQRRPQKKVSRKLCKPKNNRKDSNNYKSNLPRLQGTTQPGSDSGQLVSGEDGRNYEVQVVETQLNSMRGEQFETARSPEVDEVGPMQLAPQGGDASPLLKHDKAKRPPHVVSKVQIKVNRDGVSQGSRSASFSPLLPPASIVGRVRISDKHIRLPIRSEMWWSHANSGQHLRSFTCAKLDETEKVSRQLARRIRSATLTQQRIRQQQNGAQANNSGVLQSLFLGHKPSNGAKQQAKFNKLVSQQQIAYNNSQKQATMKPQGQAYGRIQLNQIPQGQDLHAIANRHGSTSQDECHSSGHLLATDEAHDEMVLLHQPHHQTMQRSSGEMMGVVKSRWHPEASLPADLVRIGRSPRNVQPSKGASPRNTGHQRSKVTTNRVKSPPVVNMRLADAATCDQTKVFKHLPISVRSSLKQKLSTGKKTTSPAIVRTTAIDEAAHHGGVTSQSPVFRQQVVNPFQPPQVIKSTIITPSPRAQQAQANTNNNYLKLKNQGGAGVAQMAQVALLDQNSRRSFYISEDSQRTLTPLSCKDEAAAAPNIAYATQQYPLGGRQSPSSGLMLVGGGLASGSAGKQTSGDLQQLHCQGHVIHRGVREPGVKHQARVSTAGQLRSRGVAAGSKTLLRLSRSQSPAKNQSSSRANSPNQVVLKSVEQKDDQAPACTCQKANHTAPKISQASPTGGSKAIALADNQPTAAIAQSSKNRVVFVVRNNEQEHLQRTRDEERVSLLDATATIKNEDLAAHFKPFKSSQGRTGEPALAYKDSPTSHAFNGQVTNESLETTNHIIAEPISPQVETQDPIKDQRETSKADSRYKVPVEQGNRGKVKTLSGDLGESIGHTHVPSRIEIQQSVLQSRNNRNEGSEAKCMTPQSSTNLGQVLSAINSQNSSSFSKPSGGIIHAANLNTSKALITPGSLSFTDQEARAVKQPKKNQKSAAILKEGGGTLAPKVEVKLRLSKNPNQCPPKLYLSKSQASKQPQTQTTAPTPQANELPVRVESRGEGQIITVQVQNEKRNEPEATSDYQMDRAATLGAISPAFDSIKPMQLITSEQVIEQQASKVLQSLDTCSSQVIQTTGGKVQSFPTRKGWEAARQLQQSKWQTIDIMSTAPPYTHSSRVPTSRSTLHLQSQTAIGRQARGRNIQLAVNKSCNKVPTKSFNLSHTALLSIHDGKSDQQIKEIVPSAGTGDQVLNKSHTENLAQFKPLKRPLSQYTVAAAASKPQSTRMTRLQRLYETQRGRNILQLVTSPRQPTSLQNQLQTSRNLAGRQQAFATAGNQMESDGQTRASSLARDHKSKRSNLNMVGQQAKHQRNHSSEFVFYRTSEGGGAILSPGGVRPQKATKGDRALWKVQITRRDEDSEPQATTAPDDINQLLLTSKQNMTLYMSTDQNPITGPPTSGYRISQTTESQNQQDLLLSSQCKLHCASQPPSGAGRASAVRDSAATDNSPEAVRAVTPLDFKPTLPENVVMGIESSGYQVVRKEADKQKRESKAKQHTPAKESLTQTTVHSPPILADSTFKPYRPSHVATLLPAKAPTPGTINLVVGQPSEPDYRTLQTNIKSIKSGVMDLQAQGMSRQQRVGFGGSRPKRVKSLQQKQTRPENNWRALVSPQVVVDQGEVCYERTVGAQDAKVMHKRIVRGLPSRGLRAAAK